MIKTKFTEMFGIEKPIVQGGMQHLGIAEFASLVCNAGGMGTINITCYPGVDEFHEDVIKMKEFTNNKPFIVNISLVPDLTKGEEIFKYIDVCAKEGVAAIEFAGASPVEFMPACKEAGIKIIHKSPNAKVAASMARKVRLPCLYRKRLILRSGWSIRNLKWKRYLCGNQFHWKKQTRSRRIYDKRFCL